MWLLKTTTRAEPTDRLADDLPGLKAVTGISVFRLMTERKSGCHEPDGCVVPQTINYQLSGMWLGTPPTGAIGKLQRLENLHLHGQCRIKGLPQQLWTLPRWFLSTCALWISNIDGLMIWPFPELLHMALMATWLQMQTGVTEADSHSHQVPASRRVTFDGSD